MSDLNTLNLLSNISSATEFTADVAYTGVSIGDTLLRITLVKNSLGTPSTGSVIWVNKSTNSIVSAPVALPPEKASALPSDSSTATNQASQLVVETAISSSIGQVSDVAYLGSGNASEISILKGIYTTHNASLQSILSAVNAQLELTSSVWTDISGAFYYRREIYDSSTSSYSIVYTTPQGAPATPDSATLIPAGGDTIKLEQSQYIATASGTGVTIGDYLINIVAVNTGVNPYTVAANFWINISTTATLSTPPVSGTYAFVDSIVLNNILSQVTNISTSVGTPSDSAWVSGDGTHTSLLKTVATNTFSQGSVVDVAAINGTGSYSVISLLKALLNSNQSVSSAVTPVDRSLTITTGGTAQQLAASNTSRRRMVIQNPANITGNINSESIYISFVGTATIAGVGSFELMPGATWDTAGATPISSAVSVIASTTGHIINAFEL